MIKIIKKDLPGKVRARLTISSFSPFEEGFWRSSPAINPRQLQERKEGEGAH
jgi:hypothetical protein